MFKINAVKLRLIFFILLLLSWQSVADIYIRYNQAGYSPLRDKHIIVMADDDLSGKNWFVINEKKEQIAAGILTTNLTGKTEHTAKPYNYQIDLTKLTAVGLYQLIINNSAAQSVNISISTQPYQPFLTDMLRFFRVARSGTSDTLLTPASHLGDANAIIYRPLGNIADGQWQVDSQNKTVDMLGGWYDAADYIKFTLTTAYSTYYLLRAYQEAPAFFDKQWSQTEFIDVIDEAKIGLDYLLKTFPSDNEFIIQVSSGDDHQQGYRLPHLDIRDGKREAFSAISAAHMGLTTAALALGAKVFSQLGYEDLAARYQQVAVAIYHRARQPDALTQAAFERNTTNDFYRDNNIADNMGLAAIELYLLTQEPTYLSQAQQYATLAGEENWAAWCCVTSSLNYRLAPIDAASKQRFLNELTYYSNYDKTIGNIWGIPMKPTWAPLLGAAIPASYAGLWFLIDKQYSTALLWDNVDYLFGRNNWGIGFIASKKLPFTATEVYSQVYSLTGEFPLGAVAEGPGSKQSYQQLQHYFIKSAADDYFEPFNTASQIFYNNASNFQTMESTIATQATNIYMLAVASKVIALSAANSPASEAQSVIAPSAKNKTESGGSVIHFIILLLSLVFFRNNVKYHRSISL